MTIRTSFVSLFLALVALTGCTTSSANNTTYSQQQGGSPDASAPGMRSGMPNGGY